MAFDNMMAAALRGDTTAYSASVHTLSATWSVSDVESAVSTACPRHTAALAGYRDSAAVVERLLGSAAQPPFQAPAYDPPKVRKPAYVQFDEMVDIPYTIGAYATREQYGPVCSEMPARLTPEKYEIDKLDAVNAEIVSSSGVPSYEWSASLSFDGVAVSYIAADAPSDTEGTVTVRVRCRMIGWERDS